MERLISFLFHNIGIVIVIVGIIYTMFFRKSPLERPPNRMPDFGGDGFPRPRRPVDGKPAAPAPRRQPDWMETRVPQPKNTEPAQPERVDDVRPHPVGAPQRTQPEPVTEHRQQQPVNTGSARTEQPPERAPMPMPVAPEEAPRAAIAEPAQSPANLREPDHTRASGSSAALTQDDLTRAVVWAEILGPPRSRRPHRR